MEEKGAMTSKAIASNLIERESPISSAKLAKLLNMYGEELNIIKSNRRGEYMCISREGLIIKDNWAYAAGFSRC